MRAALRGAADRTAWRWSRRAKRRAVDGAVWSGDCGIRMVVRRDYMSRGLHIPMHTLLDCFFFLLFRPACSLGRTVFSPFSPLLMEIFNGNFIGVSCTLINISYKII